MAEPKIGEVALWAAIKAFVVAASRTVADPAGIPPEKVYRAQQNAADMLGSPASVRLWSDTGAVPLSTSWQGDRVKLAEKWRLRVLGAEVGADYTGSVGEAPLAYQAVDGDTPTTIRDALLAQIPLTAVGAAVGAAELDVEAVTPGAPLYVSAGPAELFTATRTRKTAAERSWLPGEIIVQIEVVSERPRDNPTTVPSAMSYLNRILGKLAHQLGPVADLGAAGVAFRQYAMQPSDLTALEGVATRSRARADLVMSLDVADILEFDRVAAYEKPTGEAQV